VPGRLLVVDWVPEQADGRPPLGNHLFDGGLMSQDEAENRLRLHRDELAEWRLGWPPPPSGTPCSPRTWSAACTPARLHACTPARLHACTPARLHACSRALAEGSTIYLQHGFDPTRPEN
jgi:hypothetical protein